MSAFDRLVATRLVENAAALRLALPPAPFGTAFMGEEEIHLQSTLEAYLQSVAVVEVALELGLPNPLAGHDIELHTALLTNDAVRQYCEHHQLSLPSQFLLRLRQGMKLIGDGVVREVDQASDIPLVQYRIHNAFFDIVMLLLDVTSDATAHFLYLVRQADGPSPDFLAALEDPEKLKIIGHLTNEAVGPSVTDSVLAPFALGVVGLSNLEEATDELYSAILSIASHSDNWISLAVLWLDHFFPDNNELSQTIVTVKRNLDLGLHRLLIPERQWPADVDETLAAYLTVDSDTREILTYQTERSPAWGNLERVARGSDYRTSRAPDMLFAERRRRAWLLTLQYLGQRAEQIHMASAQGSYTF